MSLFAFFYQIIHQYNVSSTSFDSIESAVRRSQFAVYQQSANQSQLRLHFLAKRHFNILQLATCNIQYICGFSRLFVCLFVCLSVCLSVCPSVRLLVFECACMCFCVCICACDCKAGPSMVKPMQIVYLANTILNIWH